MENIVKKLIFYKGVMEIEEELSSGSFKNFYHLKFNKDNQRYIKIKKSTMYNGEIILNFNSNLGNVKKVSVNNPSDELVNKIWFRWVEWKDKNGIDIVKIKNKIKNIEELL
jgi:hypothetical protein